MQAELFQGGFGFRRTLYEQELGGTFCTSKAIGGGSTFIKYRVEHLVTGRLGCIFKSYVSSLSNKLEFALLQL